jgi:hypothetical protein
LPRPAGLLFAGGPRLNAGQTCQKLNHTCKKFVLIVLQFEYTHFGQPCQRNSLKLHLYFADSNFIL